ncbi:hypothetical protein EW146_g5986 [Bondarzewia mesenterica]|uniref:Uncharacterized protein n=1 Tax=Bondarzewia mesenterica TaxID=1095465 RepID=A0A4S4LRX4_9AGAM|nr:hypothetical protein EW146_g5986 [Bondarzewia mesenterica]
MKFSDGFWLLKNGVKAYHGLQVVQTTEEKDGYSLQVATRYIRHRGDTLGGPLLSIKVHSPTEGVIGVKIDHFKHIDPLPNIVLFPDVPPVPSVSLAKLSASSPRQPPIHALTTAAVYDLPYKWTLNTASNASCLAQDLSFNPNPETPPDTVRYVHSELNMSPGELIYGLGEQFGAFVKNGESITSLIGRPPLSVVNSGCRIDLFDHISQSVSVWNRDGGTSSEQAYKCVPFYMTNRGYGVFINHPGEVEVEVGSEKVSRVGVSVAGESLEYFLIYGETPLQTVSGFLQGMRERNCPVRVFHLDCFIQKQYEWCSFTFDPDNFPDPAKYLTEIKQTYGVQICVWINPYISQLSPIFAEGVKGGYFIRRPNGTPWQWDLWQPGLAIVDFTNPEATRWYTDKLSALIDLGVDSFKTDFAERIPHTGVVYHDGSDPMRMHNVYAVLHNSIVFGLLEKRLGKGQAVVFARAAHAGGQRFPVHWGGDCESTFEAMAETLRGVLSLTLSGFAFSSHDIGGFEGRSPPEVYHRWVAFGLFSSHSRLHGSHSYRIPWEYGEESATYMAKFLEAKHRLMPYLYNLAIKASQIGHPIQRAMFLEFLSDRTTHTLDRQYMLGPSLLVAPVFVGASEESEYYLPAGRWTSFFDPSRTVTGPAWMNEIVPLNELPVWFRPGTILPLGPERTGRPDYELSDGLHIQLYEIEEGKTVQTDIPVGDGNIIPATIMVKRVGDEVTVSVVDGKVGLSSVTLFAQELGQRTVADAIQVAGGAGAKVLVTNGETGIVLKLL